jgi:hypothetical protein
MPINDDFGFGLGDEDEDDEFAEMWKNEKENNH